MQKISLSSLANSDKRPEKTLVYSHGYYLYTLEVVIDGIRHSIIDEKLKPARFKNIESIRQLLKSNNLPLQSCYLIQETVYSEMIGLDSETVEPMSMPLNWHHSHYDELH